MAGAAPAEGKAGKKSKGKAGGSRSNSSASAAGSWLEAGALEVLLGSGPGACEELKGFLCCRPQDATPEVRLGLCAYTAHAHTHTHGQCSHILGLVKNKRRAHVLCLLRLVKCEHVCVCMGSR